jgi:hypothetical protein
VKEADADVIGIVQQGIFHLLQLVWIALEHALLKLTGSANSVNSPYSSAKKDRANTPGNTSP